MRNSILLLFIGLAIFLASCSSTSRLTMNVVEPSRIHIPSEVVRVGIINRSLPSKGHETIDQIDKILSLEGRNLDKEGAEYAVAGLRDELLQAKRYQTITMIDSIEKQRKGLGVFPAALKWSAVEEICAEYDVDVLFSLEFFDTDTKVDYEVGMVEVPNPLDLKVSLPGHKVTLNTFLKNGWRIYYPRQKTLIDEFVSGDHLVSVGQGINPVKAIEAIIGRKEAVLEHSSYLGNLYGLDTRPLRRNISRRYFVKGTQNFKIAERRAETNDWEGAADLWEKELNHRKRKVAGRAYYNMAIINEINGDLETAVDWASKSYSDYRNREALRYVNLLQNRMADKRLLERQLSR